MSAPTSSSPPTPPPPAEAAFDAYAANYDAALAEGLAVSGEDKYYFIRGRTAWLARCLAAVQARPTEVLDFGCGTGSATEALLALPGAASLLGLDPSPGAIAVAQAEHGSGRARFRPAAGEPEPAGSIDLAFCNGVFHHIPPAGRAAAVAGVWRLLRPGGWFAFWENNPWNPGTRYIMSRIPFDRDAILLRPSEAQALLAAQGFAIRRVDYHFYFPKMLRGLRGIEPLLTRLPFGAQYQVLAQKPA